MATPAVRVAPPRREPRKGGLKSVVGPFRPNNDLGRSGVLQYDADVSTAVVGTVQLCYGPALGALPEKTGQGFDSGAQVGDVFGGYIGVECFLHPDNDDDARVRRALELGESRFIEERLWVWLNAAANTAATSLLNAISAADEHADDNYLARPVLHMNRGDAVLAAAAGALSPNPVDDGKLWTPNGTPVVASGAYTAGTVAVSGDISVEASEVYVRPGDDLTHNTRLVIAERVYGLLVDADYRAKFTVTP